MSRSALLHRAVRAINLLIVLFLMLTLTPLPTSVSASDAASTLLQVGEPNEEAEILANQFQLDVELVAEMLASGMPAEDINATNAELFFTELRSSNQGYDQSAVQAVSHAVRVFYSDLDGRTISEIVSNPIRLVDYDSYAWIELDEAQYEELRRSGVHFEVDTTFGLIVPNGIGFDPVRDGEPEAVAGVERHTPITVEGYGLTLVQLRGPATEQDMEQLRANGTTLQYVPYYSYLIWTNETGISVLKNYENVRWIGSYYSDYRLTQRLVRAKGVAGPESMPRLQALILDDGTLDRIEKNITDWEGTLLTSAPRHVMGEAMPMVTWEFNLPVDRVETLAQIPQMISVDLSFASEPDDELSNQIIADNAPNGMPETGYSNWINDTGYDGTGITVAVVDTGVDWDHPDLNVVSGTEYGGYSEPNEPGSDGEPALLWLIDRGSGHGTHVAGIIAGNGNSGTSDSDGFVYGLGVAPGASLHAMDAIVHGFGSIGAVSLYDRVYDAASNANLSNNSWKTGDAGAGYTGNAANQDDYVLDAIDDNGDIRDFFLTVFSAGNDGHDCGTGPCLNSITEPKEAKNIVVVGSTDSIRSDESGGLNGRIDDISFFSSRGPEDGRILPHVVAPGSYIISTENRTVDAGGRLDESCFNSPGNSSQHAFCSGTSMASPHVAGAAALFTQYWFQYNNASISPLPSLVKAALINSTDDLAGGDDGWGNTLGHRPDLHQGWGRVNMDRMLNPSVDVQYYENPLVLDHSGQSWYQQIRAADPSQPLRMTLVWSDAPGHAGSTALVNDLDLRVDDPENVVWRANAADFSNGWSTPNGVHDRANNVENIWIENPENGVYLISVIGTHIGGDAYYHNGDNSDQHFSLVCYNCARVINSTSVDISLIIDSSGSMTSSDPNDMRKEGARVFVGTAQNGDGIAVVDFDSNAEVLWHMTPLTPTRTAIYEAIDQIDSSGGTNIATGLQAGYTELQAGEHDTRVAVLMTDGQSPDPSSAVSQYIDAGWPIYTIGLGSGVNQQMLDQIAYSTGGLPYQLTDPNDLIRVYFEIVGAILGGTTIANQQNLIQQGETVQATVAVPANQSQVTFLVNWPGSRVDTTLTTPSGQQITPQTVDPNVYHAQGLTYELYRITNPESGDWIVTMYGADLPPGGEMVELTVNAIGQTAMAPTANAGGPYTGVVGQPVLFDGSASYDPDGSIMLYEWDFDSDGTFDYSSSDPTATHTYGAPYNGTVILQVTDNSGTTATGAASVTIEAVLVCNSAPEGFDAGARAAGWTVLTGVPGGPEWTDLSACGPYPNWTNGAGNAACVSAGNIIVQPFDTELRTPVFSLAGYVEAYLNYQANYHNWASQDQLDLDISSDGGVTWTTLRSWQEDHGAPFGLPGENVNVNLASYLGQSNLMARWRYYTPSGQGLSYYAQLDEVRLSCTEIPPTAVTVSEMTSATSQSPLPATSLPLTGLPAAAGLAFCAVAWLRRKR